MFTGIIEQTGLITDIIPEGSNLHIWIESTVSQELKADQSVSHNGVCLTVVEVHSGKYKVIAIAETLGKTSISDWKTGDLINLERCLLLNSRLDGHLVQGHVDTTANCLSKTEKDGSWECLFSFDPQFAPLIIEKGSVCVDGISLTAFSVQRDQFTVAIIPYTYEHTNIQFLQEGKRVNIEWDMVGKYINRHIEQKIN